jgi:Ni,Fe-hydrogenase III small subunit
MKGSLQITGGVENVVPLHVDIPGTGRKGFDLPSEDSLQEYMKFPYE